jgi:hypothetical protein
MDQDPHVADPGSGSGQTPVGGVEPQGPVRQEPDRSQSVIDLMDAERQPEAFETESHPAQGDDVFEADAPSSFETHAPSSFEPPASQSSFEPPVPPVANPYVDESTREWTLGEGGVDTGAAEESLVRGDAAPAPGSRGPRPAPRAEDEDSGDERSLKEMFWGED